MAHDRIWAPWRLSYIATCKDQESDGCFLCRYRDQQDDAENLVVTRGQHALTVLNRYPYNNGHLLVAPLAHKAAYEDLSEEEHLDCTRQLRLMIRVMRRALKAQGFNIGLNLGEAAGAGVPGHLHWHLVPRWNGDTNFMPIVGDVKVIPQSLSALHELLVSESAQTQADSPN